MTSFHRTDGKRQLRTNRPSVLALEDRRLLSGTPRVDTFAAPTLQAEPSRIVAGPDGDLWFAEATGTIGRITTTGQVVEFPLPTPAGGPSPVLGGLTAGPDGAVWAIDVANNQVDRIAHGGEVQTFPLLAGQVEAIPGLTDFASSGAIVAGADGNLWFGAGSKTPNTPGTIDRISPDGGVTTFPLPPGGGNVTELAAGSDGIWFTDPSANRVGKIDYAGHVVEYGAPTAANVVDVNLMGLVVGPDGDAYYLTQTQHTIIRVAPGGAMTPIAVPNAAMGIDLLAGPAGVDFESSPDDGTTSVLSRINPDGTLTTITTAIPPASGLAFGPDGNLWWTQGVFAEVGRVVLSSTPVPTPGPTLVIGGPLWTSGSPAVSTAASIARPVGEAATASLASFRRSADVTVDSTTIDWGDGSAPTSGTLTTFPISSDPLPGVPVDPFTDGLIAGSHAYAKAGEFTVTVTIHGTGSDGAALTTSFVEPITAVNPAPIERPALGVEVGQAIAYQGPILIFATPTSHDSSGSDYTATVDWGDGSTPTAGTVEGGVDENQGDAGSPFLAEGPAVPVYVFQVSLRFRTRHYNRETAAEYTAVSYTWGNDKATETIKLDDEDFLIRPNLWGCLYYLTWNGHWNFIWADAICINQNSIEEKNAQVRAMDQTYKRAAVVSVWLGLVKLPDHIYIAEDWPQPVTTIETEGWDFGEDVVDIANRPYWTRFWVVQEFLLARQVHIWCSNNVTDEDNFKDAMGLETSLDLHGLEAYEQSLTQPLKALQLLAGRNIDRHPEIEQPLYDLLLHHRNFDCHDPRDRVFSLLSLMREDDRMKLGDIFPDYNLSHDEVVVIILSYSMEYCELELGEQPRFKELFQALGVRDRAKMQKLLIFAKRFKCWEAADGFRVRDLVGWNDAQDDVDTVASYFGPVDDLEAPKPGRPAPKSYSKMILGLSIMVIASVLCIIYWSKFGGDASLV